MEEKRETGSGDVLLALLQTRQYVEKLRVSVSVKLMDPKASIARPSRVFPETAAP